MLLTIVDWNDYAKLHGSPTAKEYFITASRTNHQLYQIFIKSSD
jgi:hypothetical protein